MAIDLSNATWRASTASSGDGGRVEFADLGEHIAMRDSTHPDGLVLVFTAFEWACFIDGVAKGEFGRNHTPAIEEVASPSSAASQLGGDET